VEAVAEALAARIADGADIPAPPARRGVAVALPLMTTLKASVYRALRESGITRAELMRRLGWNRESVDRLFVSIIRHGSIRLRRHFARLEGLSTFPLKMLRGPLTGVPRVAAVRSFYPLLRILRKSPAKDCFDLVL
jgi:hypothetical protein